MITNLRMELFEALPAAVSRKKSSLNTAELSILNTCGPAGAGVTSDSGGGGGGTAAELDSVAEELGGILYIHVACRNIRI